MLSLATFLMVPFLCAAVGPVLCRRAGARAAWVLALVPALLAVWVAVRLDQIASTPLRLDVPWVVSLGLTADLTLDSLSALFLILITGIGAVVVVYAGSYVSGKDLPRFVAMLFAFMGAMVGLVLADDLVLMFVFWELTSVLSYLLIGFNSDNPEARKAATRALVVTGGGGLAMLAGILLIGIAAGTTSLHGLATNGIDLRTDALYPAILALILAGAFTKSAQFPFHFWLPGAMTAPAPASTYLHAATMVKAGVYLLARVHPVLGGTDAWHYVVTTVGAVTMVLGGVGAIVQMDLKRILAFSTVSALGGLVLLIGLGTDAALKAAFVFLIVHALYKAALFMIAGSVDHATGTRDVGRLGGLFRIAPWLGTAAVLAGASMAGLPPLLGFIGKELLYEAKTQAPSAAVFLTAAGFLGNALGAAAALLVVVRVFFGRSRDAEVHHPPAGGLVSGPLALAVLGLLLGLFPGLVAMPLVLGAAQVSGAEMTTIKLKLWHGINPVLVLSLATYAFGALVFAVVGRLRKLSPPDSWIWSLDAAADSALASVLAVSGRCASWMQDRPLGHHLAVVFSVVFAAMAALLWKLPFPSAAFPGSWAEAVLPLVVSVGTVGVVVSRDRLTAVISLGVVGYGIALLFALYSAPDLAMTQFVVETLSVLFFVLVLTRLKPSGAAHEGVAWRGTIAVGVGLVVGVATYVAGTLNAARDISHFYGRYSLPEGFGRNVVNVILVDFRSMDTLGEVVVLIVAAIGVGALVGGLKRPDRDAAESPSPSSKEGVSCSP